MTRSSKHKSHKQSKHTSKEVNDYHSDSEGDVKMMDKNSTREESRSARITKESSRSASGEKRKLSASLNLKDKDGKVGKNLSDSRGGDDREEYVSSKRRKNVLEGGNGDADRSMAHVKEKKKEEEGLPVESEKTSRVRESKSSGDSKSRSSKRHESGVGKEDINLGEKDKEKGKEGHWSGYTNGDLKRESEKESGRKEGKGSKDKKEQEFYREKKRIKEGKRESEFQVANGDVTKKHVSHIDGADEETPHKRGKESAELMVQDEFSNSEVKELEKKIHQSEVSIDGDRCQDARESDKRNVSSRGNRTTDVKYKDERYINGSCKDEYEEDISKVHRRNDEKHMEDAEKDIKQKDIKHRENGDRASERRNEKYSGDGERERRRENRHQEDFGKDERNMDGKYWEDRERDGRRKDDKYREDSERAKGSRGKYHEDGRNVVGRDVRYFEDGDKSGRVKDEKYREESDRHKHKHKEEKHWKDYERDGGRRNVIQGDFHGDVRIRETKYRDEHSSRSRFGDKPDAKNVREENKSSTVYYRKSNIEDTRSNYDDQGRPKDGRLRKRTPGKEDHSDFGSRTIEEQQHDYEKKPTSNIKVELVTDTGRSDSRNADFGQTLNRTRHQDSYNSSSYTTRVQNRLLKQDEADYGDYTNGGRVRHNREYVSSQLNENAAQKDELHTGGMANDRSLKTGIQNSPGLPVDKSTSSSVDKKWNRDGEETGQRGGGSKDAKAYSEIEERGSRDLPAETHSTDESYRGCGDTGPMLSPFARNTHLYTSSRSLVPSPPDRGGTDNPLAFGSAGEDIRNKSNNRHRRMDNTSMGRGAGGPWNSRPNWTPPVTNGFMPFQPTFGFHPMLPQFPCPPIYSLRPIDFNHPGIPFPISDADRYTNGHGRTMGWRNPMDDVCPPHLHGWETNNASIRKDSHIFPDWNHGTLLGDRLSEPGGDEWTSSKTDTNLGLPSKSEKVNSQYSNCSEDLPLTSKSGQQVNNEQNPSFDASSQSTDVLDEKLPVAIPDTSEEILYAPKIFHKNKLQLCQVYLSVLDISADLSDPETFRKCTNLQNVDEKEISDAKDRNIFYDGEVAEDKEKSPSKYLDGSLFSTISDSLFQKAMSLYLTQKDKLDTSRAKHLSSGAVHFVDHLKSDADILSFGGFEAKEVGPAIDEILPENVFTNCSTTVEQPNNLPKLEDLSNNSNQKCDESVAAAVVDHRSENTTEYISVKEENVCALEVQEGAAVVNSPPVKTEEPSDEKVFPVTTKHDPMVLSDVSSKAFEVVLPELVECESVNLDRIHHSPESTR